MDSSSNLTVNVCSTESISGLPAQRFLTEWNLAPVHGPQTAVEKKKKKAKHLKIKGVSFPV